MNLWFRGLQPLNMTRLTDGWNFGNSKRNISAYDLHCNLGMFALCLFHCNWMINHHFNSFLVNVLILHPLGTSRNQRFSGVFFKVQKQSSRGDLKKRYSEKMQQIYRRAPMPKCDFNKVANCKATLLKTHFGMGVLL